MPENRSLRPSRPTLNVGGQDQATLAEGLLEMKIIEDSQGLYSCEALFGNWGSTRNTTGYLYFDRRLLDFGKPFKVKLGADASSTIFDGRIMALEAEFPEGRAPELRILAEDRFQDLRMTRRTRTYTDMNDADIIRQIAGDHGLSADVDVQGPTHKVVAQVNQSNLAFLRERARTIDAELWMEGNSLIAKAHNARSRATVQMAYRETLRSFTVIADLAHQRTSVTTSGWDVTSKKSLTFEATEQAIRNELNGDEAGVSILAAKLGARKEVLAHSVPIHSAEAQAEAEAFFRMSARRFVVGQGISEADPRLRVGNTVELSQLGPLFSGKYRLCEVRHIFDGRGIHSEFIAERPGLGKN
jgi:phage protein D